MVFRTGAPDFKLSWRRAEGGAKVVIEQPADNIYQATLPVAVVGSAGETFVKNVEVAGPRTEVEIPARFVVHTVGPHGKQPQLLKKCYENCLDVAVAKGIRSIAFCGKKKKKELM